MIVADAFIFGFVYGVASTVVALLIAYLFSERGRQ